VQVPIASLCNRDEHYFSFRSVSQSSRQHEVREKATDAMDLRGAHLLLQTRTKVLNNEFEGTFRQWYPQFRAQAA